MVALLMVPQAKQNFYHQGEGSSGQDSAVFQGPARKVPREFKNPLNLSPSPIPEQRDLLFPDSKAQSVGRKTVLLLAVEKPLKPENPAQTEPAHKALPMERE